jgi:hypothetical protein
LINSNAGWSACSFLNACGSPPHTRTISGQLIATFSGEPRGLLLSLNSVGFIDGAAMTDYVKVVPVTALALLGRDPGGPRRGEQDSGDQIAPVRAATSQTLLKHLPGAAHNGMRGERPKLQGQSRGS